MGKQNMPSIVQSHFWNEVAPSDLADICHVNVEGEVIGHDFCDEMKIMLICAYIELILPLFSLVGSFLFRKEAAHVLGANLPALCSVITGSLFLALNYKKPFGVDQQELFKAHVGMATAVSVIGALCMCQTVLSFIGVLACGSCCEGERVLGLFAFIFTMIGLIIVFAVPIGSMAIGWTYAFGECSGEVTWNAFFLSWRNCDFAGQ